MDMFKNVRQLLGHWKNDQKEKQCNIFDFCFDQLKLTTLNCFV